MGAIIAAGAMALAGGIMGSRASSKAASQQMAATQEAIAEQRRQYDQNRADLKPWRNVGTSGIYTLADMLGLKVPDGGQYLGLTRPEAPTREQFTSGGQPIYGTGPSTHGPYAHSPASQVVTGYRPGSFNSAGYDAAWNKYQSDLDQYNKQLEGSDTFGSLLKPYEWEETPDYQFIKDEGTKAVQRDKSARGLRVSGAYDKALARFIQNNANTFWSQGFARDQADKSLKFNMLSGVAMPGAQVTVSGAGIGQNNSNQIADLITQRGNAQGAGTVGSANAWTNAGQNFADLYFTNQFLNGNRPNQNNMQAMTPTSASFGTDWTKT